MSRWNRYWFAPSPPEALAFYRIVCFATLAATYWNYDDRGWAFVSPVFWMPVSVFHAMPQPHDPGAIGAIQAIWKLSLLTSAAGLLTGLSTGAAAILGIFVLGLPNNYGTSHHNDTFVVLLLLILAVSRCGDAWSLDDSLRRRFRSTGADRRSRQALGEYTWPFRLAQALFLLVFAAAGIAKLRHGGVAWMSAANLRALLLSHLFTHHPPTHLGSSIAASGRWSGIGAVATVLLECSALPALFISPLRAPVLAGLFGLQVAIVLTMGVYFTPQIAGYLLFLPWGRIALHASPLRRRWSLWRPGGRGGVAPSGQYECEFRK